jgi:hypothetical protein
MASRALVIPIRVGCPKRIDFEYARSDRERPGCTIALRPELERPVGGVESVAPYDAARRALVALYEACDAARGAVRCRTPQREGRVGTTREGFGTVSEEGETGRERAAG